MLIVTEQESDMTHPKDILDKLDHDMVESLRRQAEETPRPKKVTVKKWRERT